MPTVTINPVFDGVNDVVRTPGSSDREWDNGWIGYYSAFLSGGDDLVANATFTGSNWTVNTLRFSAEGDTTVNITDSASGGNRSVRYMEVGNSSNVSLENTFVRFLQGNDGGTHNITLGDAGMNAMQLFGNENTVTTGDSFIDSILLRGLNTVNVGQGGVGSLNADREETEINVSGNGRIQSVILHEQDDTINVSGNGRIEQMEIYGGTNEFTLSDDARINSLQARGDNTIALNDNSRIFQMKIDDGNNTITTEDGFAFETITGFNTSNTITVGNGGIGSIRFGSNTAQSHDITANGYVDSISIFNDQSTTLVLNDGAGAIQLGHLADDVTTGDNFVRSIVTQDGNDRVLIGDGGSDSANTGDGDDVVTTNGYVESLSTGNGNDRVNLGVTAGRVNLGQDDDLIILSELGTNDGVSIFGNRGNDTVSFQNFSTSIIFTLDSFGIFQNVGAPGGDIDTPAVGYFSEVSIENITGSNQDDMLTGDFQGNVLRGRSGDDILEGGAGADQILGGSNDDTASFAGADAGVTASLTSGAGTAGDAEGDTYISIENFLGSAFDDNLRGDGNDNTLNGGAGDDFLRGAAGDDLMIGGAGADNLQGGTGIDTATYAGSAGAIEVSLATGTGSGGDAEGDTLGSIENVIGTRSDDIIFGSNGDNILSGSVGDDVIRGASGDDILRGGRGDDSLGGGGGADVFEFRANHGADTVRGFNTSVDMIEFIISGLSFGDLVFADQGSDVLIDYGSGTILVEGQNEADMVEAVFEF